MMKQSQTLVTGIGCICALGSGFSECMENLLLGTCNCSQPTRFPVEPDMCYPVFEVDDNHLQFPEHIQGLGRTAQLAILAAMEALADSGHSRRSLQGKRVGVCIGTTVGSTMNNEQLYRRYHEGGHPEMLEMERYFRSNPAEAVAREFNLHGPVLTVANACSSGTDAIGIGQSWLRAGLCDIVIAGGSDELSHISYLGFISLMITSERACTPFDRHRTGLNLGEGAAMFILEGGSAGDRRKCEVAAYGTACDAYHVTTPHPQGLGLRLAIADALQQCGDKVAFINAHGTGTADNDRVEMQVIGELFPGIPYFSVKGATGHTLGAAGAIEAALTAGSLLRGKIPASPGFAIAPEGVTGLPTRSVQDIHGTCGLSQSLAFGGNNSVLILRC